MIFKKIIHSISAERTTSTNKELMPAFYQHQKVYSFCKKHVVNRTVLEVGCGGGYGTNELAKVAKKIIGIDNDELSIKYNTKRYFKKNLSFLHANIEAYSANHKSDAIIALQLIEHLKNPELFLNKASSLLKKDGVCIISTPNSLTQSYNENPYHYKEYNADELSDMLNKYFTKVTVYGLHGDTAVKKYETLRKKRIIAFLKKDKFNLRRFLPFGIRQLAFDFATFFTRKFLNIKASSSIHITEKNYSITSQTKQAIDLIAVCNI
jgi:2-polyprenyl-3-methyl-5-hydroxy-6-metoxy-1,4-benzoquinol methylase